MICQKIGNRIKNVLSILEPNKKNFFNLQLITGGCINSNFKLTTNYADFFLKTNSTHIADDFFLAEKKGVQLLSQADNINVPEIYYVDKEFILMSFIKPTTVSKIFWQNLASSLVNIHSVKNNLFGLDYDNYIGSLSQQNNCNENWTDFFIERRIMPQLKISNFPVEIICRFENFFKKLEDILVQEKPTLLHGDFWSGNFINNDSKPFFIDPSVYFGSREMDIAMSKLFGGFDTNFYSTYNEIYPLMKNWEERLDIYNIYPLLVHHNLFGGNYYVRILDILKSFA